MYVQVFQTKNEALMKALQVAIKEKFINCRFTLSAIEGKPLKLNLEGAEDEREKVQFANAFAKEWIKDNPTLLLTKAEDTSTISKGAAT